MRMGWEWEKRFPCVPILVSYWHPYVDPTGKSALRIFTGDLCKVEVFLESLKQFGLINIDLEYLRIYLLNIFIYSCFSSMIR